MSFQYFSYGDKTPPEPIPAEFTLTTPPGTDIWRKPPSHISFNAPLLYRAMPLASFRSARVTVAANWKTLYDQGGLALILPQKDGTRKWVKTGIEFVNDSPQASTVAADRWADWSLLPIPSGGGSLTVEMEREMKDGKPTTTLWIYVIEGVQRNPIREVTWVFEDADNAEDCWVGAYACKPTKDVDDPSRELEVSFAHLHITTA